MGGSGAGPLISVHPDELSFEFELDKAAYCNLKIVNKTEHHVAFKVKTTSPRKYLVRPNASIVQPWDSCTITVTLQAQKEYPVDMQCKDKFLIQSTRVAPLIDVDELPADTFNKEGDKVIEEMKLKVVYVSPGGRGGSDYSGISSATRGVGGLDEKQIIHQLKEERDTTLQENTKLQQELDMLKRRKSRKSDASFSLRFAAVAGLIGLLVGFIMKSVFSSPSSPPAAP